MNSIANNVIIDNVKFCNLFYLVQKYNFRLCVKMIKYFSKISWNMSDFGALGEDMKKKQVKKRPGWGLSGQRDTMLKKLS